MWGAPLAGAAAQLRAGGPAVLIVRAERDAPANAGVDTFVEAAKRLGVRTDVVDIAGGHHDADLVGDAMCLRAYKRR